MSGWGEYSREVIRQVHESLPADATFEQRRDAVRRAYPFGERAHWPYKQWCKAQREYLRRFEPPSDSKRFPLSPLEKLMRRSA